MPPNRPPCHPTRVQLIVHISNSKTSNAGCGPAPSINLSRCLHQTPRPPVEAVSRGSEDRMQSKNGQSDRNMHMHINKHSHTVTHNMTNSSIFCSYVIVGINRKRLYKYFPEFLQINFSSCPESETFPHSCKI